MEKQKKSIPQTNRTMLFEEINPEQPDLLTLLREESADSLTDDKIKEVNSILLVKSFDQFLRQFRPVIYGVFDTIQNKMRFTLKRPSARSELIKVIPLDRENEFLSLMIDLMDAHIKHNGSGKLFQFDRMLDFILPEKAVEHLKEVRANVLTLYKEYVKSCEEQPEFSKDKLAGIQSMLNQEINQYQDVLALLPLALSDLKRKLFVPKRRIHRWNPIVEGISGMVERDLQVIDLPEQGEITVSDLDEDRRHQLKQLIHKAFNDHLSHLGTYVEHLILRSYGLEPQDETSEQDMLAKQYNQYLEFYTQCCTSLMETAKPVIEKILGVKVFFDQYQVKTREMEPELLITNVNNELWVDYQKAERLNAFLNTVNCKTNYENTIWFAILPNITFPPDKVKTLSRERFQGNVIRNIARTNSIGLAGNIMNVLSRYQIQTFFSFECDESTTFIYTAKNGTSHYEDGCKPFINKDYSDYAIPCFPNFTLIPKEKSYLMVGKKVVVTEEKGTEYSMNRNDCYRVWMGGIHLEASYVAAGLVAAYQCPEYLQERYEKNTVPGNPGVRYDIERENQWVNTTSTMGREITGYNDEILREDQRQKFGFFFSSEDGSRVAGKVKKQDFINCATVLSARSLGKNNEKYDAIYKNLTMNYIERIFRYNTFDYKKSEIIHFFKNYSNSTVNQWRAGSKQVNGILQQDDYLSYQLDEKNQICVLELAFGDDLRKKEIDLTPYTGQEGEQ